MPSPFPGMNPYLEQDDVWHSFHEHFCFRCFESLVPQVGDSYIVTVDQHVYIHDIGSSDRRLLGRGDVQMARLHPGNESQASNALIDAPVLSDMDPSVDIEEESFVQIRDRRSREVVTILELLSPANKRNGPDREQYIWKRKRIVHSNVNLIEIDFLRGGPRMPDPQLPECHYYALVRPSADRPRVGIWPINLHQPLPVIPVPLRPGGPEVKLDLQSVLHQVYDSGGYARYIYDGDPQPPLSPEDQKWALQLTQSNRT